MLHSNDPKPVPPVGLLRNASLFLDFDGTLVELAQRPEAVLVSDRLRLLLHDIVEQLRGHVAIVTGRPAMQVRELLAAEIVVVGSHGLEFMGSDGRVSMQDRPAELDGAVAAMRQLAGQHEGLWVEEKPLGAALHFRQCPEAGDACVALARDLAAELGLHLQPGKMLIELRAAGGDKGTAIRALMREPIRAGTRPVFMGDDVTDEPGFAAAAELGGAGILIGEQRETTAGYRLAGVADTIDWLQQAAAQTA